MPSFPSQCWNKSNIDWYTTYFIVLMVIDLVLPCKEALERCVPDLGMNGPTIMLKNTVAGCPCGLGFLSNKQEALL